MSLLFQAMDCIAILARKADVHGTPRVSITFDTPSDEARFEREVEREVSASGLRLTYNGRIDCSESMIHGIKLRITHG